MRTLIALYSNVTQALLDIIKPERVVLIASETFRDGAAALRELESASYPGGIHLYIEEADPNDPTPWQQIVARHIQAERRAGHEVTVDVTGGKTPMTLGAYAAAEQGSTPTAYLASQWSNEAQRAMPMGLINIPSVRDILGLDWLTSADNAFTLGRFDAASALYARAAEAGARGADVLVRLSRARQAWLDGHYAVARSQWPNELEDAVPVPWNLLVGRLAGKRAYELDDESFGAWLRDRRVALRLRHQQRHASQDVAREAFHLVEVILRSALARWLNGGGQLVHADGQLGDARVDGKDKLTLGLLFGLACEGHAREWVLRGVPADRRERVASPCRAIRGEKNAGLEIRNGLAHGYARLKDVERWVESALADKGPLEQLIRACIPFSERVREPSSLEQPEQVRQIFSG